MLCVKRSKRVKKGPERFTRLWENGKWVKNGQKKSGRVIGQKDEKGQKESERVRKGYGSRGRKGLKRVRKDYGSKGRNG